MGARLPKRLLLVLTAIAFMFATVLPHPAPAMAIGNAAAMAGGMERPCGSCPDKSPIANVITKMASCALACAGVGVALPTRQAADLPAFGKFAYSPRVTVETAGITPAPDPFPPRPVLLV